MPASGLRTISTGSSLAAKAWSHSHVKVRANKLMSGSNKASPRKTRSGMPSLHREPYAGSRNKWKNHLFTGLPPPLARGRSHQTKGYWQSQKGCRSWHVHSQQMLAAVPQWAGLPCSPPPLASDWPEKEPLQCLTFPSGSHTTVICDKPLKSTENLDQRWFVVTMCGWVLEKGLMQPAPNAAVESAAMTLSIAVEGRWCQLWCAGCFLHFKDEKPDFKDTPFWTA